MSKEKDENPFAIVYQGFKVSLPVEEGERRFVQIAFGTEDGTEVSLYDTRGMLIDATHHIRAVDRISGYLDHDEVEAYLDEKAGVRLVAVASGREFPMRFALRGLDIMDQGIKVAGLTFSARGGAQVEVIRSADGEKVRGRWNTMDWSDAADILGGYGYDLTAKIQSAVPAPPTR